MFCGNCGNTVSDGVKFCPHCGTSMMVSTPVIAEPEKPKEDHCTNCGTMIPSGGGFCPNCGKKAKGQVLVAAPVKPQPPRCSKCSLEVPEGTRFCPNCGNSIDAIPAPVQMVQAVPVSFGTSPVQKPAINTTQANNKFEALGNLKYLYATAVVALVLLGILPLFVEFYDVSAIGDLISDGLGVYGGDPLFGFVGVLVFVGAAAYLAMPMFTERILKPGSFTLGIVAKALLALIIVAGASEGSSQAEGYAGLVSFSITFGGWMIILIGIAGFVADIVCIRSLKQMQ